MMFRRDEGPFLHAAVAEIKAQLEKLSDKIEAELDGGRERLNRLEIDVARLKQSGSVGAVIGTALVVALCGLMIARLFAAPHPQHAPPRQIEKRLAESRQV